MALTKNDLVEQVHKTGLTKKDASDAVESLLEIVKKTLTDGEDVLVSGFGKFCVRQKNSRRI